MTRIPAINPRYADDATSERTEKAWELLDQVRQFSYSRVTRRANLTRHAASCPGCSRRAARSEFPPLCGTGRQLAALAAECDRVLGQLGEQLAELDKPPPEPVPDSPPTLFA